MIFYKNHKKEWKVIRNIKLVTKAKHEATLSAATITSNM